MRKIFSYIIAGLALLSVSACVHEQPAVFDPSKGTAPVLLSSEVTEDGVTAEFTPGSIDMGFNQNVPLNHSFAIVELDGAKASKTIPSNIVDKTISVSKANLSKILIGMGKAEGSTAALKLVVRMSLQDPTKDSGINGFIDSEGQITIGSWLVEVPQPKGNPWKDYTEKSTWSVIGSIASTGNSWGQDEPMFSDGSKHVAKNIKFATGDQFKIRNNGSWDDNRGATGDVEPFVLSIGEAMPAVANGKNLAVPADGNYDLLYDPATETITITEAFQTYPGFDTESEWSVIGAIASFEMEWNKDIAMTTDGTWHVAEGVTLTANDQFKFRKNQDWGDNFGATGDVEPFVVALDTEYEANPGGKNLAVPEDGVYDLLVNPEAKLFKVVMSLGGSCHLVGEGGGETPDNPDTPVVEENKWSLIGKIEDSEWNKDFYMTESDGVWTSPAVSFAAGAEFKIRFNNSWADADCVGASAEGFNPTPGEPFKGEHPGKNIIIKDEGVYQVEFKPESMDITVFSMSNRYSLIGSVEGTSWNKDFFMDKLDGGIWKIGPVKIGGEFKIRYNMSWADADCYGAPADFTPAVGQAFVAAQPGSNITVPEGNYFVTFNENEKTVLIEDAVPGNLWAVIGNVNGTMWNKDFYMTEDAGVWVSEELEFGADAEFKLRFNNSWADPDCFGGAESGIQLAPGVPVTPVHPGNNLKVASPGKYHVVYDSNKGIIFLQGWALIGAIEESMWNKDFFMTANPNGIWTSDEVTIKGEFKLRNNSSWADPDTRGYGESGFTFTPGEKFLVASPGNNIKAPAEGKYTVSYNPVTEEVLITAAGTSTTKVINTADEFIAWLENPTVDAELGDDINIVGKQMTPAPEITGNFDGKGKVITFQLQGPLFPVVRGNIKDVKFAGEIEATCGAEKTVLAPIGKSYGSIQGVTNAAVVKMHGPAGEGGAETKNGAIAAGVVGEAYGLLKDCGNVGEISANASGKDTWAIIVAGVAGVAGAAVESCSNSGNVSLVAGSPLGRTSGLTEVSMKYDPVSSVAGIVTYAVSDANHTVTVKDCNNTGNISFTYNGLHSKSSAVSRSPVAGIVANSGGDITNCHNHGDIEATMVAADRSSAYADINIILHAAGVQGSDYFVKKIKSTVDQNETSVVGCSNTGSIYVDSDMTKSNNTAGGVCAWPAAESASVTVIKDCFNTGNLFIKGKLKIRAGGVAGGTNNMENCKNSGNILVEGAASSSVFGLINGFHTQTHTLKNCEATGTLEAKLAVSGLGGICGGIGDVKNTLCDGCKVNATIIGGGTAQCGLIVGHLNGKTKEVTIGTAESPVTVAGTVNEVKATAENYMSLIHNATNYTEGLHIFNAVYGE